MTLRRKRVAFILVSALLSACATPPAPIIESKPVVKAQPTLPNIVVFGRSSKAIIEDIIRYRTNKGMKLLSRTNNYLEFSANITKANIPTEARIQYTLSQVSQGWQLSARVLQISYPGTKKEKIDDITHHVSQQLNEELARYATN